MKFLITVTAALLPVFVTSAHAQSIQACVNGSSGEIKIREHCQPGWTALSLSTGSSSPGGKLVGEKTWIGDTLIVTNEPQTIADSTFTARTNGGPLLINTTISLFHFGGDVSGFATCYPMIDGQWAGVYGGLPTGSTPPFDKEHVVLLPRLEQLLVPWTPSRVYPGVPAGTHTFGLRCEGSLFHVFGPGVFGAGANVPASISIIELQ